MRAAKTLSTALCEPRIESLEPGTCQILKSTTMAEDAVLSIAFSHRALRRKMAVADILLSSPLMPSAIDFSGGILETGGRQEIAFTSNGHRKVRIILLL